MGEGGVTTYCEGIIRIAKVWNRVLRNIGSVGFGIL
jgi:hypothetical protein